MNICLINTKTGSKLKFVDELRIIYENQDIQVKNIYIYIYIYMYI